MLAGPGVAVFPYTIITWWEFRQSCCCDRVGALCFRLFPNRYNSGGAPKFPKWPR